jgi:hypothetical protein
MARMANMAYLAYIARTNRAKKTPRAVSSGALLNEKVRQLQAA